VHTSKGNFKTKLKATSGSVDISRTVQLSSTNKVILKRHLSDQESASISTKEGNIAQITNGILTPESNYRKSVIVILERTMTGPAPMYPY
jgi:non-canonical (house-cleaning) NTP pyrophosphatase